MRSRVRSATMAGGNTDFQDGGMEAMLHRADDSNTFNLEAVLAAERGRLVRLCAQLTGEPTAAEDLAQETLIEAWRHADALRNPAARQAWLSGIARNVCRRWLRRLGRERGRRVREPGHDGTGFSGLDLRMAANDVLEIQLERDELAALLDQALALLPAPTRDVLLHHFIAESSYAEIADQLGLSEGAVAVRAYRGKLALRRILRTDLRDQAVAYGLVNVDDCEWQETRIWCRACGQRRLLGRLDPAAGTFILRCPSCCAEPGAVVATISRFCVTRHDVFHGIKGFKTALFRLMAFGDDYYRGALTNGTAPCLKCHRPIRLRFGYLDDVPPILRGQRGVEMNCTRCGVSYKTQLTTLAISLPEGRRFWRAHPRIRTLPEREIEVDGNPALVVGFQSVSDTARFEVVYTRDRYQLLGIHNASGT